MRQTELSKHNFLFLSLYVSCWVFVVEKIVTQRYRDDFVVETVNFHLVGALKHYSFKYKFIGGKGLEMREMT